MLKWNGNIVSILAVLSGLLVSSAIYFFAQGDGFSNGKLILTGIGMQAFLNALISWMLLKASEYDVSSALRWLSGSLNGVSMDQVPRLMVVVVFSTVAIFLLNRHLEILQLGGSTCQGAWHKDHSHTARSHFMCVAVDCVCNVGDRTDCSVAFLAGPIAARISGSGKSNLMTSALTGCVLVMVSDLVGQYAFHPAIL